MVCVPALSFTVRVPINEPLVVGANLTKIWQVCPLGPRDVPQLLVWVKFAEVAMLVMLIPCRRLFCNVAVCAVLLLPTFVLGKLRLDGVRVTPLVGVTPVPLRFTVWHQPCVVFRVHGVPGALLALLDITKVPGTVPAAEGENVTVIVHFPFFPAGIALVQDSGTNANGGLGEGSKSYT